MVGVVAVKRFIINNSLAGTGPPLPAGVGADQPKGILGGPSVPLVPGQTYPYGETPLTPPISGPGLNVPVPHVTQYNTAQCPPGYYRSGGICVPIELPTGVIPGPKGSIQKVEISAQTTPGAFFLIKILVTNMGTTVGQFSAKVTIPALNIAAQPTAGSALEPGQSVVIHKQIQMPATAPTGQLLPAMIELIRTDKNNVIVIDDTEQSTIPSPGTVIPTAEDET